MQEMSDEYKVAQARLMLEQASDVDIIVTTALIPGRKAPILVTQEMLAVKKAGSVSTPSPDSCLQNKIRVRNLTLIMMLLGWVWGFSYSTDAIG